MTKIASRGGGVLEVLVLLVDAVRYHISRSHGCKLEFSRSGRVKRRRKRTRRLTLSRAGFFGAPVGRGGGAQCAPPPPALNSSAVFNLTRARFPKWKELKSSKSFWLLVFASPQNRPFTRASWSWRVASDQKFRHVWTYPHRLCHGKEGAPCRFAACPARCARCKYHAGHYYSVISDGSTRQDEAIAITVRFVNEQWEIIQRLVRIDIVAKFVAGTQLSQVLMESLFMDLHLRGKQVLAMITDGAAINRAAVRNLDPR